ncbi:MAG: hypothetical protein HC838_11145 [Spirulinaceae cyanobacterium RM2_2_10]|nr:hypothetical protein [Spirulinaceae cyanobacterium SM2_1_0]NJO20475.1 hypothetical protein [Spirulinaceae cyanobacterium RM2_2_10]
MLKTSRKFWLPVALSTLGLLYFAAASQLPVFFVIKVPLTAMPLQLAALGYVWFYWQRRSRRRRQLDSEHLL